MKRSSTSTSSSDSKTLKRFYDESYHETDEDDSIKQQNETPIQAIDLQISAIQADSNLSLRNGKISRIRLVNFMCHANFVVNFNNRVNMIVGNNGSGKSAILTGLMVGLGAKALATHRCTNLSKLIKTGENTATVEIEIVNDGPHPYEPKKYGSKIIVERQFSQNSSSYRMKNQSGKIVSKNRDDLNQMLLYFNIQIDNPIFMLTQDAARSWLRDLDPRKNYDLYLKATLLETVLEKLNACCLIHKKNIYFFKCYLQEYQRLKQETEEFGEKLKLRRSAEDIKNELALETLKKSWIKVTQQEQSVSEILEVLNNLTSEAEELRNQIENRVLHEEKVSTRIEVLEKDLESQKLLILQTNEVLSSIQVKFKEVKDRYENAVRLKQNLQSKIQQEEEQIADLELEIEDKQQTESSEKNLIQFSVTALKADNKALEAKITDTKVLLAGITEAISTAEEELKNTVHERKACLVKIDDRRKKVGTLQSRTLDSLAVYGRNIKAVRDELKMLYEAGELSELPRGPFGTYLKILDAKWLPIIEQTLGRFLHAFIVNNDKDRNVLNNIFHRFRVNSPIITTKFQKTLFDLSSGRVSDIPGCVLFISQIECDDPVVINCLIDRCQIETILLTEDQKLAIHLTAYEKDVPKNLRKVIVLDPLLEYLPAPLYRIYSLETRIAKFLQVNTKEKTEQVLNEIENLQKKKADLESLINQQKETLADLHHKRETKLQIIENCTANEALNLNNIAAQEKIDSSVHHNGNEYLVTELKNKKSSLIILKDKLAAINDSCEVLHNLARQEKAALKAQTAKTKQVEATSQTLMRRRDDSCYELRTFQSNIKHWEGKSSASAAELERIGNEYKKQLKILQDLTAKAVEKGDRINAADESEEDVQKNIVRLTRRLKKFDAGKKIEEVEEKMKTFQQRLEEKHEMLKCLRATLVLLREVREKRFRAVEAMKFHMGILVKHKFEFIMRLHGYAGIIDFDHLKDETKIAVVPRDSRIENAVLNTKCLSGGERSYSTVAFLIALWSCVEHPFFFLDEYDVFTDQINRQRITRLLLKEAKERPKCQYVFITPQDVSFVRTSQVIKRIRLADPHAE